MKHLLEKLSNNFTPVGKNRSKLLFIIALFIIVGVMDLLGLALIGPLVSLMFVEEHSINSANKILYVFSGDDISKSEMIFYTSISVLILYLIKGVVSYLMNRHIINFSFDVLVDLRKRLMYQHVHIPYIKYLARGRSSFVTTIITYADSYVRGFLMPCLRMGSDIIVFILISIFLIIQSPILYFILISLVFLLLVIYFYAVKNKIYNYGSVSSKSSEELLKKVNQSLVGLKEIRVLSKEQFFIDEFETVVQKNADALSKFESFMILPKYMVEYVIVVFVVSVVLFFSYNNYPVSETSTILGYFSFAGLRIMPSVNQFATSLSNMRNAQFVMNEINNDLLDNNDSFELNSSSKDDYKHLKFSKIKLNDICYNYPGSATNVLNGISLSIKAGECIAITGKSGEGKSTLIDIILGLLQPTTGEIIVNSNITSSQILKSFVAYIPQDVFVFDDTIKANISLSNKVNNKQLKYSLAASQLREFVDKYEKKESQRIAEDGLSLSGGQRQRIAIARAFYHDRQIMILDEATSALDSDTEKAIINEIKELKGKMTFIIITHRESILKYCDQVYKIDKGSLNKV